ncbi:glycosyltransferase [Verrucomicrobiales bacterium]|nr:glycosyltransferase [Verrucomicrobiales bacterium]
MKVVQVSASLSRDAGGIFEIELALSQQLHHLDVLVQALGLEDARWADDSRRWFPISADVCRVHGPAAFGFSCDLLLKIEEARADIGHLQSLWMYPSVAIRRWHERSGKPYIVTPNGMLEPWALSNSAWKKRIAGTLYERRCLQRAACLQANTEKEMADFRAYGLRNPVCIIPNGVELPEVGMVNPNSGKRILLFLGRLHPKKGLINALRAWKEVLYSTSNIQHSTSHGWQFVIAGWDEVGHEAELKLLCAELDLAYSETRVSTFLLDSFEVKSENSPVVFVGPAFGKEKDTLLRSASAFILPSFSEGLPMSVLEAWSYQLPVLMTDQCNIPEGFVADAAFRIGTDTESIAEGMRLLFSLPATDTRQLTSSLSSMGKNGRSLVERQFTWPQVATQMKDVYEWVLGGGDMPACVQS